MRVKIILDVTEEEKKNLTIEDLLKKFAMLKGAASDRLLLAN